MPRDTQPESRRGLRWFQFRISSLLLVTLLAAVLLGWRREPLSRWVDSLVKAPADTAVPKPAGPSIVFEDQDAELIKQIESADVDWGPYPRGGINGMFTELRTRWDSLDCEDIPVIYLDDEEAKTEEMSAGAARRASHSSQRSARPSAGCD